MKRRLKYFAKVLLRHLFVGCQRLGVNLLPNHYYSQIPNVSELRRGTDWRKPMSMVGVQGAEVASQVAFLASVCDATSPGAIPVTLHTDAIAENGQGGGYGEIEAAFLYAFVLRFRPQKIIQIGCGVSTSLILRAAREGGYVPEIVCVEPYPSAYLLRLAAEGRIQLVKKKAQTLDVSVLTDLSPNDLLFIDSTHTVKAGSEVNKIVLEVLPRLREGVWVHFHDIFFPYDYTRDILSSDLFFWLESTLVHAFLVGNRRFEIKLCQSMLHYSAQDELRRHFAVYDPQDGVEGLKGRKGKHFPSSLYLRTMGD